MKLPTRKEQTSHRLHRDGSGRIVVEVIACTVADARHAAAGGADRLEIVRAPDSEGLTPDIETVKRIRDAVTLPLHAMIRSRNVFIGYSAEEIDAMQEELRALREVGIDGVVLGFLSDDRRVDFEAIQTILKEARKLSVTFHRAFDHVQDQRQALLQLIQQTSVHRVLTSGGAPSAVEGKESLADLFREADGRIGLIAGGGITADTLPLLVRDTGLWEFHIGRGVRTPPTYAGTVDVKKVSYLTSTARRLSEQRSATMSRLTDAGNS